MSQNEKDISRSNGNKIVLSLCGNHFYKYSNHNQNYIHENEISVIRNLILPFNNYCSNHNLRRLFVDYEIIEKNDIKMIKMDYIPQNLEQVIKHKKLTEYEIKEIFTQILMAIQIMHNNRYFHNDIKLTNILLTKQNQSYSAFLIDFQTSLQLPQNINLITHPLGFTTEITPSYLVNHWSNQDYSVPFNPFMLDLQQLNLLIIQMKNTLPLSHQSKEFQDYVDRFSLMTFSEKINHPWIQSQYSIHNIFQHNSTYKNSSLFN